MQLSLYNGVLDKKGSAVELQAIIQTMTGESLKPFVLTKIYSSYLAATDEVEKADFKKQYDNIKKTLPAVTWSGLFSSRKIAGLEQYSNLICLDIDHLTQDALIPLQETIPLDPYTFLCFLSPSGQGIKVIIKVDSESADHKQAFEALEKYYKEKFFVEIDKSGKDVSRLCFLCYSPSLDINKNSKVFPVKAAGKKVAATKPKPKAKAEPEQEDLYSVIAFTDKLQSYVEGNRNNYIHLFACNANRKGFDQYDVLNFSISHFSDKDASEVKASVLSAYNNKNEYAKFKKSVSKNTNGLVDSTGTNTGRPSQKTNTESQNSKASEQDMFPTEETFWHERTITKGRGENKYNTVNYDISHVELSEFLTRHGFHLKETHAEGWQLCRTIDGIIKIATSTDVAQYVVQWTKANTNKAIQETVRRSQSKLFTDTEMRALDYKDVIIKTDNQNESFFYFKNCWVTVTAAAITPLPYTELQECIWSSNKNDHDFIYTEPTFFNPETAELDTNFMSCEFMKFVYLAAYNPSDPEEKDFTHDMKMQRFESFCTSIGFMLDGYKHPAERKAIFALDHKVGDRFEKNGRSGKSMIPKACSFLKKTCTINGKTHDPRYAFRYEPITADAQIVNFNDMKQGFDVEEIFEIIADNYNVLRRNNGYLFFEYENSPKVWYSANGIPKGEGGSYRARMHILEFSDFFTPEYTPYDHFGHGLFSNSWDANEWNAFYSFMLWCVCCYKGNGLVEYPASNLNERRLTMFVSPEFIDIIENLELMPRDKKFDKAQAYNAYNELLKQNNEKISSSKSFLRATQEYCKAKGLYFNPHKGGKRDSSNSIDWYTLSTTAPTQQIDLFKNPQPND